MPKTSNEVCTEALRLIGVVAEDEPMTGDQFSRAQSHMTDIFATLNNTKGLAFTWTIETVPDGAFLPFARAIGGSVCTTYSKPEFVGWRKQGMDELKEFAAPDMTHENHVTRAEFF